MKLRSGRRIVRRKNIYLPTEVWVDIFCYPWITRQVLAQMVGKIGNRWFGEQLQFYLHEWGKHTLGYLHFTKQGVCKWQNGQLQQLKYPQTAMPENMKSFEFFRIDHFDNRVFNFFRRIQRVLTADKKLEIYFYRDQFPHVHYTRKNVSDFDEQLNNVRTILGHLLPFMDGIHTIDTDMWMITQMRSLLRNQFHAVKVFRVSIDFERLAQLEATIQSTMESITTSSNEPKLLQLCCNKYEIAHKVLKTIRKQFMEAKEPSTFAVIFSNNWDFPAFQCENGIGEQLRGIRIRDGYAKFTVFCHQANAESGDQLRQWVDGNVDRRAVYDSKQYIRLRKPTIGSGHIFAMPDLDEADNEAEEEKPSTSKKRRICE